MWDLPIGLFLDLCWETQISWLVTPGGRFSPAAQREHILTQLEVVPSGVKPGSAAWGKAIDHLSRSLRATTDVDARTRISERVFTMAAAHKQALAADQGL